MVPLPAPEGPEITKRTPFLSLLLIHAPHKINQTRIKDRLICKRKLYQNNRLEVRKKIVYSEKSCLKSTPIITILNAAKAAKA